MASLATMGAYKDRSDRLTPGALHVKGVTPELHRRVRLAAAEEAVSYAKLIDMLLDQRDARQRRQRAAQASPLHRPPADTLDDDVVPL